MINFKFYCLDAVLQLAEHLASHWNFVAEEHDPGKTVLWLTAFSSNQIRGTSYKRPRQTCNDQLDGKGVGS